MAILNRRAGTQTRVVTTRFFDNSLTGASKASTSTGLSGAEATFLTLNNSFEADSQTTSVATFTGRSFATAPSGFSVNQNSFVVYINGIVVANSQRIIAEGGGNVTVTFSGLGYDLDADDKILLVGKVI